MLQVLQDLQPGEEVLARSRADAIGFGGPPAGGGLGPRRVGPGRLLLVHQEGCDLPQRIPQILQGGAAALPPRQRGRGAAVLPVTGWNRSGRYEGRTSTALIDAADWKRSSCGGEETIVLAFFVKGKKSHDPREHRGACVCAFAYLYLKNV